MVAGVSGHAGSAYPLALVYGLSRGSLQHQSQRMMRARHSGHLSLRAGDLSSSTSRIENYVFMADAAFKKPSGREVTEDLIGWLQRRSAPCPRDVSWREPFSHLGLTGVGARFRRSGFSGSSSLRDMGLCPHSQEAPRVPNYPDASRRSVSPPKAL